MGWVTLAVKPNARPVADGQHLEMSQYGRVDIQLAASDADQDPLQYRIVRRPESGELTGQSNSFCYNPSHGYIGRDSFQFAVNDGFEDSEPATVEIGVVPWFSAHPFLPIVAVGVGAIWYICLCGCLLDRGRRPECFLSVGLLAALVVGTWLGAARTLLTTGLLGGHCVALCVLTVRARSAARSSDRKQRSAPLDAHGKQGRTDCLLLPEMRRGTHDTGRARELVDSMSGLQGGFLATEPSPPHEVRCPMNTKRAIPPPSVAGAHA